MKRIHGDISLLCYFPVDVPVEDNNNVPITADDTTMMSVNVKDMASEDNKVENICNDSAVLDDSLLAKALSELAEEDENVYVKPRGKNYRYKARRVCDDVGGNKEEVKYASTAQRVRVVEYLHFDRDIETLPGKGKKYLNQLWSDIKRNGLQNSLSLSVSRKKGRAVLFDGNHRLTLFRNKKVEWVPLKVSYYFIEDEDNESFRFVPEMYDADEWPVNPTPENIGFQFKK